jgi:hypothetical protein
MSDTPKRLQLRRTKGWRMPENTAKVDRSTRFGNPWTCHRPFGCPHSRTYDHGLNPDGSPAMSCCIDTFREWVRQGVAGEESHLIGKGGGFLAALMAHGGNIERTKLVEGLPRLRGKHLACWCPLDQPCHADVLLELANAPMRCDGGGDG